MMSCLFFCANLIGRISLVKLVYSEPNGRERFVELGLQNSIVTVGRNADSGIQTNNASVSRVHAMITCKDGRIFVQDPPNARPTNGTKVDGMPLQPGEILELFAGSELICGNFVIRVVADANESVARMGGQHAAPQPQMQQQPQPQHPPSAQPYGAPRDPRYGGAPNYPAQPIQPVQPPMSGGSPMASGGAQVPSSGNAAAFVSGVMSAPPSGVAPTANPQYYDGGANARAKRGPQRAQYPTHQGQAGAGGASASPSGQGHPQVNPAMLQGGGGAQEEFARLRGELDEARAANASREDEVKSLRERLEERERSISDLERRCDYHDTVVTGLNGMIDNLKQQLDHQREQHKECQRDLVMSEEKAENLQIELTTLKETLESKGMATSNAETTIANLKVQLTQKNRHLTELQREHDLTQYAVREERENVERLEKSVEDLNRHLEESQRHCRDMKKVVEQHEAMYGDMKSNIEERAREIRQLQDALRAKGGGDASALVTELSQTKELLARRAKECERLEGLLRSAESQIANAGKGGGDASALQARVAELEAELATAGGESVRQLTKQVNDLKRERRELKEALDGGGGRSSGEAGGGLNASMLQQLQELYQGINDVVSQWRDDLNSLENCIHDLQRAFVAYVKIDVASLSGADRSRVENMLQDYDPKVIFEDIANLLDMNQNSLGEVKGKLKALRGVLQSNG